MKAFVSVRCAVLAALALAAPLPATAAPAGDAALEELRNTVVNLLQALVEQGVMTRDKAAALVQEAQERARADAAATAAAEAGAVRVPYVPEPVREQIREEVAKEVRPAVVDDVVARAREEGWGVPAALPDWLKRVRLYGDVRLRYQYDAFASGNVENFYLDFNQVNARGGIARAGASAFLNVTEDRSRLRVQARLGLEAELAPSLRAALRLTTGNLQDPVSLNQTLGNTGARYTVGFDQAYLRWDAHDARRFPRATVAGGRIPNPWLAPSELVWDRDLAFEGLAATARYGFGDGSPDQSAAFLTLGAFPVQEVELTSDDKWLLGAQLGATLRWGDSQRLRVGLAYYDFQNVVGRRNPPDGVVYDWTAPQYVRVGNTLFDIRNDLDPTTNLFALAADYDLVNLSLAYELPLGAHALTVVGDAVRNIGFDADRVLERTGTVVEERNAGYVAEIGYGSASMGQAGRWRAALGYRYVERDAVLDAWTDSDFRGGGTDAEGFYLLGDYWLGSRTWLRLRYLSGNEIDGAPAGLDTVQFDVNGTF